MTKEIMAFCEPDDKEISWLLDHGYSYSDMRVLAYINVRNIILMSESSQSLTVITHDVYKDQYKEMCELKFKDYDGDFKDAILEGVVCLMTGMDSMLSLGMFSKVQ